MKEKIKLVGLKLEQASLEKDKLKQQVHQLTRGGKVTIPWLLYNE